MIEDIDRVGLLFLSDLSRQECSTYTTQQEFDVPDSPTGHGGEKGFRIQQTHDGDRSPDVSSTRSQCFPENAEKTQHLFAPHRVRGETRRHVSHFTECAEDRMKQVSNFTEFADGPNKGFCTPRSAQETRIRPAQSARTQTCSRQSLPSGDGAMYEDTEHNTKEDDNVWCEQRSTFPDGLTKGQLLNRFCGHQCNLTTLLDLCTDDRTAQREGYRKRHQKNRKTRDTVPRF